MIPATKLHAILDAGHTAAYDLAGDIRALIPGDGGFYSDDEVAQIRAAVSRDASVTRADISAALRLLDSEDK